MVLKTGRSRARTRWRACSSRASRRRYDAGGAHRAAAARRGPAAAVLDLHAAVPADAPVVIAPGSYAKIPTGITLGLPPGTEGQVRPRSGLAAQYGVTLLNTPGTIDADYRGEVSVLLINHGGAPF